MNTKNTFIREVTEITDDGVIVEQKRLEISQFEKEPSYVKLYLQDIGRLSGLNNSEQKLINELVFNMGFNNIVPAYKPVKQMIALKTGMKYNTIDKALKELCVKGILIRKARGFYIMDPNLFGRGSWKDISNIRLTVVYNENGTKSINTEISKQLGLFKDM